MSEADTHTQKDLHAQFRGGRVPKHTHTQKHTNHSTQHTLIGECRGKTNRALGCLNTIPTTHSLSDCSRGFAAVCVADDSRGRIGTAPKWVHIKVESERLWRWSVRVVEFKVRLKETCRERLTMSARLKNPKSIEFKKNKTTTTTENVV